MNAITTVLIPEQVQEYEKENVKYVKLNTKSLNQVKSSNSLL